MPVRWLTWAALPGDRVSHMDDPDYDPRGVRDPAATPPASPIRSAGARGSPANRADGARPQSRTADFWITNCGGRWREHCGCCPTHIGRFSCCGRSKISVRSAWPVCWGSRRSACVSGCTGRARCSAASWRSRPSVPAVAQRRVQRRPGLPESGVPRAGTPPSQYRSAEARWLSFSSSPGAVRPAPWRDARNFSGLARR